MKERDYYFQVELLLQILPFLQQESCFSLKGGTAINLFFREMPRLSVDIDLTYLPLHGREESLQEINNCLKRIAEKITRSLPLVTIQQKTVRPNNLVNKLFIRRGEAIIKLEPNEILRGSVYLPKKIHLAKTVVEKFGMEFSILLNSFADVYAGKICAALDRQHPRDLFDIKILMEHEGITKEIQRAFVIYLASHNRPIEELLNPNLLDIQDVFKTQFEGMSSLAVTCKELEKVRIELISILRSSLTEDERYFLLSIASDEPDWDRIEIEHVKDLPAIQWRLLNVQKMTLEKKKASVENLRSVLGL
ncbi:MAG: nucleotidyl transferase AbiEii/AbiGii toxin family protein [Bdellovibrionota bacterium]